MTAAEIKQLREAAGSAAKLAAALTAAGYPVSRRTVEDWCQGRRQPGPPYLVGLQKLQKSD